MKNDRLLTDCLPFEVSKEMLNEMAMKAGPLIVKGVLQRANAKNQNGRIYPKDVLEREAAKYMENFVKERRALGELDHEDSEVVNLKNVSHNITNLYWNGDDLIGEVEILSTPSGNILKELFKSNIKLGISSRGMGSVKKNVRESADEVQDDYSILCWDFVSNPSVRGAFMFPTEPLQESKKNIQHCDKWQKTESIIMDILSTLS
jgi:hypothetical protein